MTLTLLERWLIRRIARRRVLDRRLAEAHADRDFWRARNAELRSQLSDLNRRGARRGDPGDLP